MRRALVVGIDYYEHIPRLHGCVNDAHAVKAVLDRHGDGTVNFDVMLVAAAGPKDVVSRGELKDRVEQLFAGDADIALLYFAGHGHVEATGGYLCGSDCRRGDDGLSLGEVLTIGNGSKARNKVIILDSCHSGVAGAYQAKQPVAELSEGLTILTASTEEQYSTEENGSGVFTTLFVDAMNAASDLVGNVTPGSVYAHIDQSLGSWEQRPVFKTNVKSFVSLRKIAPPIDLAHLQRITEFFPQKGYEFQLDPSYEPRAEGKPPGAAAADPTNTANFAILQKFNRVNLVVPIDAAHMWDAAIESKKCKLTVLGEHYRRLVAKGRI